MNLQTLRLVVDSWSRIILMLHGAGFDSRAAPLVAVEDTRLSAQSARKPPFNWQEGIRKSQLLLLERDRSTVKEGCLSFWHVFQKAGAMRQKSIAWPSTGLTSNMRGKENLASISQSIERWMRDRGRAMPIATNFCL
ncbi:MAG TPA: hypothetical protein VE195_01590 [Acidobacteriaceae bacterium]|nr:hypothetical protein [Acidobacteriaceae bacterium]